MTNFLQFLIRSSADPSKLALTVRGLLLGVIPTLLFVAKILGVEGLVETDLQAVVDSIVTMITAVLTTISAAMTLIGLGRKFYYLYKGKKS